MEIKTLATGSGGNAFLISDGQTKLLLECGLKIKDIQKALNYQLRSIEGCLVSHRHKDHIEGIQGVMDKEVNVYMPTLEVEAAGIKHHRIKPIEPLTAFEIGTWLIMPFPTEHDTEQPVGYLLQSAATGEKLLFATDTYYIQFNFKSVTHFLIECNYSEQIIKDNLADGIIGIKRHNRTIETHLSLENLITFLNACDLSKTKEIRLIHLSDTNSNEEYFKKEVVAATGIPVKIEPVRGF